MASVSILATQPAQENDLPFPFLLHFLEASRLIVDGEQTGGAPTETETGDRNGPTKVDTVEDEDVTSESQFHW
jgi:hypothetical protein